MLSSRRELDRGQESWVLPISVSYLLCALEGVPASHDPCLSVPIGTMRGWSQILSKDMLIPWISAVQRLKRLAKGSWPGESLLREECPISEP